MKSEGYNIQSVKIIMYVFVLNTVLFYITVYTQAHTQYTNCIQNIIMHANYVHIIIQVQSNGLWCVYVIENVLIYRDGAEKNGRAI